MSGKNYSKILDNCFKKEDVEPLSPSVAQEAEEKIYSNRKRSSAETGEEMVRRHNDELHEMRKVVFPRLYNLSICCLGFDAVVLLMSATGWINVSEAVLIALLTTTTATVLGLFAIAANWLFPKG